MKPSRVMDIDTTTFLMLTLTFLVLTVSGLFWPTARLYLTGSSRWRQRYDVVSAFAVCCVQATQAGSVGGVPTQPRRDRSDRGLLTPCSVRRHVIHLWALSNTL